MTGRRSPSLGGPRLALVMGAGGARGFAHVGALRIIQQAGIPVDLVVGVSMDSLNRGPQGAA
jgi:NTE family protein